MLTYIIKLHIYWSVFLLVYWWLFSKETHFHIRRMYLLSAIGLGLIAPLIQLPQTAPAIYGMASVWLKPIIVTAQATPITKTTQVFGWFFWIYLTGCIVQLFFLLVNLYKIYRLRSNSDISSMGDIKIAFTNHKHPPFSFANTIFLSKQIALEVSERQTIVRHEQAHVEQHHTLDVLLIEILRIPLWFSPCIYLFKLLLSQVHEYLADEEAIKVNNNVELYGTLLLRHTQIPLQSILGNHFITSQLKNRIIMMTKKKSSQRAFLKYALSLPIAVVAILLLQERITAQTNITLQDDIDLHNWGWLNKMSSDEFIKFEANGMEVIDTVVIVDTETFKEDVKIVKNNFKYQKDVNGDPIYERVDRLPKAPSCNQGTNEQQDICTQATVMNNLMSNIKYPAHKLEAMVYVLFVVDKDGQISKISTLAKDKDKWKNDDPLVDFEKEALRVAENLKQMGKWQPGTKNGKPVNTRMVAPIKFKLN